MPRSGQTDRRKCRRPRPLDSSGSAHPDAARSCEPSCRRDGNDDVLVRTVYSAISRGTESLVFKGEVPPSQYKAMRAPFQEGEFPGPVKYGYTSVGQVEEGPDSRRTT